MVLIVVFQKGYIFIFLRCLDDGQHIALFFVWYKKLLTYLLIIYYHIRYNTICNGYDLHRSDHSFELPGGRGWRKGEGLGKGGVNGSIPGPVGDRVCKY
jgi:hypothetical protein